MKADKTANDIRIHSSAGLCDCYPGHCLKEDAHGKCWCEPEIIEINGSKIFVHQDEN